MQYIQTNFSRDLKKLVYTNVEGRLFFGGAGWEMYSEDTRNIPVENLAYFCFCLFSMVCADQNMHSNFRFAYADWERKTKAIYPKFGWKGFSEHNEKPFYLLSVPERNGVDFNVITDEDLKHFVDYNLKVSLAEFGIVNELFFKAMVEDVDFSNNIEVFNKLKLAIIDSLPK